MSKNTKKPKLDFNTCEQQILQALDWRREYEAMGVRFASDPDASGWQECFALFRDESKPSAAVNTKSSNGSLGYYTDLGDKSQAIRPWEVMARLGLAPTWQEARERLAKKAGVELPKTKPAAASLTERESELRITPIKNETGPAWLRRWVAAKPGITIEAAMAAGAEVVGGHFGLCVRFPIRDPKDLTKIIGSILYRCEGSDFPASSDGKLSARKCHVVGGYEGDKLGLIIVGTLEQFAAASRIQLCEGPTDAMAVAPGLPPDRIAVSASEGAKKFTPELAEPFRGKLVDATYDADVAGEAGAVNACHCCLGIAAEVRNPKLPYEVADKHGKDLRDLVNEGNFAAWLAEVEAMLPLTEADLPPEQPAAAAGEAGGKAKHLPIANSEKKTKKDPDGNDVSYDEPLPMSAILDRVRRHADGWPCRVDQSLFVPRAGGVDWLGSAAGLFGWLQTQAGKIYWHRTVGCVTKDEFFCELRRTATKYLAVETLPHEPPVPGHYYCGGNVTGGDGSTLAALIDRFCPATPIDSDLILAAFLTPFWGGPPGKRPCFVITSDDGAGAGKSTLVDMIDRLVGGAFDVSEKDDFEAIKKRMLTRGALGKRIAKIDNLKSMRFSWSELEGVITAPAISGHRMFEGEGDRPNLLTWFITLNGANLSRDMAMRSIVAKVKRPTNSATWHDETTKFIDQNRETLIADIVGRLREVAAPLSRYTRWADWERDVLARLPEPSDAQRVIAERQKIVDVEEEEAQEIEEFFADQLRRLGYAPHREKIFLPSDVTARWFNWATGEQKTKTAVSRKLKQLVTERRLTALEVSGRNDLGRGFNWIPKEPAINLCVDILDRLRKLAALQGTNTSVATEAH